MAVAFELMAKIGLDDSEYKSKLGGAKSLFKGFGSALKTGAKVAAGAFAAIGTAAAAVTTTIIKQTTATAQYGDKIDKMSQKMNMSTDAYQEWDAVLQHCGTSIESMQASMKTLATAAETGNKAFDQLGISQEQIASMSEEQLFEATIAALQGVESETERTYLASKLLGRGATELGPLLNMSAEETEAMRQRVHELGGVMSEDAVKAAARYTDSLQDMQTAFAGLKNNLFKKFMPGITTVMDGLTEIFSGNSDKGIGMIQQGVSGLAATITEAMPQLIEVAKGIIGTIGNAILENLPALLSMGAEILINILTGIIQAIPQLVAALPQVWEAIKNAFIENWPAMKAAGQQLLTMLAEGIVSALGSAVSFIRGKLAEWVSIAGEKIVEFGQAIHDGFLSLVTEVGSWINDNIIQPAKDAIGAAVDVGRQVVDKIKQGIQNAWSSLTSWFKGIWNNLFGNLKVNTTVSATANGNQSPGFAKGLDYVPYDEFPAILHKGEAVLTAEEADVWRKGGTGGVININQYMQTRPQSPVEIAAATRAAFEEARWAI